MAGHGSAEPPGEVAGRLRTAINRLAFHLRKPATAQGITPTRLSVLAALGAAGPHRPGDLADKLGVSPASMSRLVDVLTEAGWVDRAADPDDNRASLLTLSSDGQGILDGLRQESTSRLTADVAGLTAAERKALQAALPVLEKLADERVR